MNALSHFPRKWFQLCHSKSCKKTEKWPFQMLRTFVFELKEASKPFSKKFPMTKFWFKNISMLCFTFTQNSFNFVAQKLAKHWKMSFTNTQNIQVLPGCFKTIFWNAYHDQLWIQRLLNALPCIHSKRFQFHGSKMCKKLKFSLFKGSVVHLLLTSR